MSVGTLLVRHDPASAAVVRREIVADLATRSLTPDSIDDVVLVASELVGNAVVHAGDTGELDVSWFVHDDAVTIQVDDGSLEMPVPRHADGRSTSGRGLAIVAAIAAEWGVHPHPHGKQVWARVPITAA